MKIEHTTAVRLSVAHWADRTPIAEHNIKQGDVVNTPSNTSNHLVLRVLGNYCITEDMNGGKQYVAYLPDLVKVTNKKSLGCMLRYHKDAN